MKIESQIKCLLARYGKVSLVGRGVFRCVSESARVEDGKMLPPLTRVVFEECEAGPDRMLTESVMNEGKMSWTEAREYINNVCVDVDEIVRRWDYLPQNYGLRAMQMPVVKVMPVKWLDAKYAAVVAVAALMNMVIPFNGVKTNLNEAGIGLSTMQKVVMPVEEVIEEESIEDIVVNEMHYAIVVASFDNQESAMRCLMEGSVEGAVEVIEKDGRFRVCGMQFATYDEANTYIRENSLKAWVMKL